MPYNVLYNYELQSLADSYTKVKLLQEQLNNENSAEDNELLKSVHKAIEPKYSQDRHRTLLYGAFVAISVISSFLSMIVPHDIYVIILVGTLLTQLTIGFKILKDHISNNYSKKELISIRRSLFRAISIVFLATSFFAYCLMFVCPDGSFREKYINEFVCFGVTFFSYVFHILLGTSYFSKQFFKHKKRAYIVILSNSLILFICYICFMCCMLYPFISDTIATYAMIGIGISLISELIFLLYLIFVISVEIS